MSSNLIEAFRMSFRIKTAYRVNSIIFALKQIPIIKKLLPASLYKSEGLKRFAKVVSFIWEIASSIIGKAIYLGLMVFLASSFYKGDSAAAFINIFMFLTFLGGVWNPYLFEPSKDKYYAVISMRFDPKKYVLSNYYYFLIKNFVFFMPFTILFGRMRNVNLLVCTMMPFFVIFIKNIVNAWVLYNNKKTGRRTSSDIVPVSVTFGAAAVFLALAYGLPYLGYSVGYMAFYIIFALASVAGIITGIYIAGYDSYRSFCKDMLDPSHVFLASASSKVQKDISKKQITYDNSAIIENTKSGYDYFHELFVIRHRKILFQATKRIAVICAVVIAVLTAATVITNSYNKEANNILKNYLPYLLFIMYFINRGERITRIMFMNCDSSMLSYRFYRQPKAVLTLFKKRIITMVQLNLIPALIIAAGWDLLLFTTGGSTLAGYILTPVAVISMAVFFSVHYLVMYYLLQPYNAAYEMKNPTFSIINAVTYFICFAATKIQISTMIFGIAMMLFALLYCTIALVLVYKYAPKTFKLR